jgi:cytochrome c biogenesis protein CcdA/thiol-disulfide isomerase/thioredoxin
MMILIVFAFVSGLITILAPCIWPLLPIVLSSSATGGKRKPLGITLGIIASFSFFTLAISYLVKNINMNPDVPRFLAVVIIGLLGFLMVIPTFYFKVGGVLSRLSSYVSHTTEPTSTGLLGGLITGLSLGVVWSPCAGPILATIAALAVTREVSFDVVLVTLAYVIGVGIPLFLFSSAWAWIFTKSRLLSRYTGRIQQAFGIVMILTAIGIYTNYDTVVEAKLLDTLPSYAHWQDTLEGNPLVQAQLEMLTRKKGMPNASVALPNLGPAQDFFGITQWLNTSTPLSLSQLRGKVVLVDFWTYACINCIRTLPYVTSLYEKYQDAGFIVIGVHTPEFEYEKRTANVERALKQHKIHYPVAQDNDYATWKAYHNRFWPAQYLIDTQGNIRMVHTGEGAYEEIETAVQVLLRDAGNMR